jgi:hypothetical protein
MNRVREIVLMLIGLAMAAGALGWGAYHLKLNGELTWHTAGGVLVGVYAAAMLIDQRAAKPFRLLSDAALRAWTRTPPKEDQ